MKFKPIDYRDLEESKDYLFKIEAAGITVYTVGNYMADFGYYLQSYQYLTNQITHYAEIEE